MKTRCPTCRKLVKASDRDSAPDFPFCSRRCRMADLDRWFTEEYAISGDAGEEGEPDVDPGTNEVA